MKHIIFFTYILSVNLLFWQCSCSIRDCSVKRFSFINEKYYAYGCLVNNTENGDWRIYNDRDQLIEKGVYENGLKIGKWYYPENRNDSVIIWKKYEKKNLNLLFSIPALLDIVEDSSAYIKFSNKDTAKLFNIVLSIHNIQESKKNIEEYYKQGEEEIIDRNWAFINKRNKIITDQRVIYFNEYLINTTKSERFKVLNMYSVVNDNLIFEVSCRFDERTEPTARTIFFSLLSSSFYNNRRFINPLDEITYTTITDSIFK